jgi:hypothetical protein
MTLVYVQADTTRGGEAALEAELRDLLKRAVAVLRVSSRS